MMSSVRMLMTWLLVGLLGGPVAWAQAAVDADDDNKPLSAAVQAPEYGGVVVDQTISGLGRQFYVKFSEGWHQLPDTDNYALVVKERPSPRGGTEIQVMSNDQMLMRQFLPRSHVAVTSMGLASAERVLDALKQLIVQAALSSQNDLAQHGY
jgi:Curli assembly protein CsgE